MAIGSAGIEQMGMLKSCPREPNDLSIRGHRSSADLARYQRCIHIPDKADRNPVLERPEMSDSPGTAGRLSWTLTRPEARPRRDHGRPECASVDTSGIRTFRQSLASVRPTRIWCCSRVYRTAAYRDLRGLSIPARRLRSGDWTTGLPRSPLPMGSSVRCCQSSSPAGLRPRPFGKHATARPFSIILTF